jgi:glycosyltransferase involved in cell wall biosynthesis
MKILMVSKAMPSSYPGGTQTHVANLSAALAARGHAVSILTASGKIRKRKRTAERGVEIIPIPYLPGRVGAFHLHPVDDVSFNYFSWQWLRRHSNDYDVIHLQGRSGTWYPKRRRDTMPPGIVTFHGHFDSEQKAAIETGAVSLKRGVEMKLAALYAGRQERMAATFACGVIAVSDAMRSTLEQKVTGRLPLITVIPNGVSDEEFHPRAGQTKPFRIVSISRLDALKGHTYLLQAINLLRNEFPQLRLHIIGDGPQAPVLRRMIDDLDLHSVVQLTGPKYGSALLKELHEAQLFVLPSLRETQGIVFMEALMSGVPVVGGDIPGVREMLRNGEDGILVPVKDAAALAGAIAENLRHPERARTMAENGRARMMEHYRWSVIAEKTENLYKTILDKHHA